MSVYSLSVICLLFDGPLGEHFYWRGMETSSWRVSSLNCPTKNWDFFLKLYWSPKLPQPHQHTSWDSHSRWSFIEWCSGDRWQITGDRWQLIFCFIYLVILDFWYWCYYPHTTRDSVSPLCRILFIFQMPYWILTFP